MQIGLLGSGLVGGKLGTLLARAGHGVTFSSARDRDKLERLSREAGGDARAGTPAEAAQEVDAVHWSRLDDVLSRAGDLSGRVLITCSLPMNADDTGLVAGKVPGAREAARPALVYCGDDPEAKGVAAGLMGDVGFEPADAGPLRTARDTEPFGLLIARPAYGGRGGPKPAYRFSRCGGGA